MSVQFIIGIDGGGTKTHGRIKQINTDNYFEAYVGASSLTNDFELATKNISTLISQLMGQFVEYDQCNPEHISVVIGAAGAGAKSQADKLVQQLSSSFSFASLEVCNDAKTSLIAANNAQPVTVVALGTGSVGARLDSDGCEHYYGGWGFPAGDDGGGAKLGFNAVQYLLQDIDNSGKPLSKVTANLQQMICSKEGAESTPKAALAAWLRNATASKYAEISPLVFSLQTQCSVANKLIEQHVKHCEALILTSRKNTSTPVVLLGGLAQVTLPLLSKEIAKHCQAPLGTSLDGACWLAENNITSLQAKVLHKQTSSSVNQTSPLLNQDNQFKVDPVLLQQLNNMMSEERNPDSKQIDLMESKDILRLINNEDKKVPLAVELCIEPMSEAVDCIVDAFNKGGRLIYIGAGTSGRLGILDAVECPPTFSVSSDQVVGLIAGGDKAIYKAVEGAEDNIEQGEQDLIDIEFSQNDVLVGIAASGRTPYVIGALDYANKVGAKTVCVVCNTNSEMSKHAKIVICPAVGPEVLTGSTRLKSGTAQKLVLNMLSTASMIRTGKSYENLMVDVNATNKKLYMRAIRIVMQATECDASTAEKALKENNLKVKLAILHILTGVGSIQGQQTLLQNNGFLRTSVTSLTS
jgi:N-acetylmuramic acid 6-phosphate etherase